MKGEVGGLVRLSMEAVDAGPDPIGDGIIWVCPGCLAFMHPNLAGTGWESVRQ